MAFTVWYAGQLLFLKQRHNIEWIFSTLSVHVCVCVHVHFELRGSANKEGVGSGRREGKGPGEDEIKKPGKKSRRAQRNTST